jgi:hypothetical protein
VARECEGPDRLMKTVCPRQCRRRQDADTGQVRWAGFPVNLDFAFSREQRDKVYVQHVMRRQGSALWRWLEDGPCVCEAAAERATADHDPAESMPSR